MREQRVCMHIGMIQLEGEIGEEGEGGENCWSVGYEWEGGRGSNAWGEGDSVLANNMGSSFTVIGENRA